MQEFLTAGGALALVKAFVDFLKYVINKDGNGVVTVLVVWTAGIGAVLLVKWSDVASNIPMGATTLEHARGATIALAGLGLGSAAAFANTSLKAIDTTQSAATPPLTKTRS